MNTPGFFILFLLLSTTTVASAGNIGDTVDTAKEAVEIAAYIKDLLATKCFDGDWSVADRQGASMAPTRKDQHIRAYVDIVGFKEESILNGTHYVNGSAKEFAIVKRKAWNTPIKGRTVSFETKYVIFDHNGTTTAITTTRFHWKYKIKTLLGSRWVHVHEGPLRTSCTVIHPEYFTTRIPEIPVKITAYNQSFAPVTYVSIPNESDPVMKNIIATRISYNGSTATRHDMTGWVVKNDHGTELVNFEDKDQPLWVESGNEISHQFHRFTIFCEEFNESRLNISFVTPYEVREAENYSIEQIGAKQNAKIPITYVRIILMLIGFVVFAIILVRVIKRVL